MIKNTEKEDAHPIWLGGGNPDAIVNQEKRGQSELVNSSQLPSQIVGDKSILEAAGVKFGEASSGDELFTEAELPKGWKLKATDHDMWSHLIDENTMIRAKIFYKAAFYDRRATMNILETPEAQE